MKNGQQQQHIHIHSNSDVLQLVYLHTKTVAPQWMKGLCLYKSILRSKYNQNYISGPRDIDD